MRHRVLALFVLLIALLFVAACSTVDAALPAFGAHLEVAGTRIDFESKRVTQPAIAAAKSVADAVTDATGLTSPESPAPPKPTR